MDICKNKTCYKVVTSGKYCDSCRACSRRHAARVRAKRKELGLCCYCNEPRIRGEKICQRHFDGKGERYQQQRVRIEKYKKSPEYVEKKRAVEAARREKAKLEGKCVHCRREQSLPHTHYCLEHFLYHKARKWARVDKGLEILKSQAEFQQYKCFYTGVDLVPGVNMSVDHVIPRAHKDFPGDDDVKNLVWCDKRVNRFKTDMTYSEMLALCGKITDYSQKRRPQQCHNSNSCGNRIAS